MIAIESISQALLRQLERQEAAYWSQHYSGLPAEVSRRLGAGLLEMNEARAVCASDVDILAFNRVVGLGTEEPVTSGQLEQIREFYRAAGVGRFFVQVSPYARPHGLPALLRQQGFRYHNNWVKLYRPVEPLPVYEAGLRIETIGREQAGEYAAILTAAFEWPEKLQGLLAHPVGRPGWRHYLAYRNDRPIAGAALFIRGAYASLAFAATLPEHRGLGAQSALIARRFRDAAEAGCRWMFSETAEETPERPVASFRNMIRLGFEVAYARPNFLYAFG